jgi:hypothetical protein
VRGVRVPRWALAASMVGVLVLAVVLVGPPAGETPLDPASTAADGLRGVRDLLEGSGVQVDVSLEQPVDISTRAFVPIDRLTAADRAGWLDWVRAGGTLIVADPGSRLHGLPPAGGGLAGALGATPRAPACDLPALAAVEQAVHAAWRGYEVPTDGDACFPVGEDAAWLVVRPEGRGTVVALGAADPFTNGQLDRADNAVLAAALLGPSPDDRLVIVPRPAVGGGDTTLVDLVPTRIWHGLLLLLVAAVLGVLWRGRRLGPPVADRLPPVVPAAELARSVADLLQRAGSRDGAARQLRANARRDVGTGLGAPAGTEPTALVELLADRTGLDATTASLALLDTPVGDDRGLVDVARAAREARRAAGSGLPAAASVPPRGDDRPMDR